MRYGDKRTAYNGIFNHVFNVYPKAKEILEFYKGIPKDQQHKRYNPEGLKDFMKEFRKSVNSLPSSNIHKNAKFIQQNFGEFIKYCQNKLK